MILFHRLHRHEILSQWPKILLLTGNPMDLFDNYTRSKVDYSYDEKPKLGSAGIHTLLGTVLNLPNNVFDPKSCDSLLEIGLGKITGIPPVLRRMPFMHINPAIIKWGMNNLLPAPQDSIFGYTCQQLYSEIYSERFRQLYQTLCWNETSPEKIKNEHTMYMDSSSLPSFQPRAYLESRCPPNNPWEEEGSTKYFHPPFADVGFWLRRYGDGSYSYLKKAFQTILEQYDSSFLFNPYHKDFFIKKRINENQDTTLLSDTLILTFSDVMVFGKKASFIREKRKRAVLECLTVSHR